MQNTKPPTNAQLRRFQQMNCIGCFFADDKAINQVKPCCTRLKPPETAGDLCLDKRPLKHRR